MPSVLRSGYNTDNHCMHSKQSYRNIFILLLFVLFALPIDTEAQIPETGSPFIFEIIPTYPRPGDTVTVHVKSFSIELDRAAITWRVDGRITAEGTSVQEVSFEAGSLGSQTFVSISAFVGGQLFSDQITIRPADIDLLFEADTYTPPFYRGKALPSAEANITIVALPQIINFFGGLVPARDLIFTWRENGRVLGNSSGRGKNTLQIKGPRLFNTTILEVAATTVDESITAKRLLALHPLDPLVVFYENSPLFGTKFNKAISSTFELQDEEIAVTAYPFYFSGDQRTTDTFEYSWVVNGQAVESSPEDKSTLVLRQTGSGEGSATIALTVQNLEEVLQRARNSFTLMFGNVEREALFGF